MPSRTRASCWRGPGFRGTYFSTLDPELAARVAAADGLAPGLLSPVLDSRARSIVRLYEHPATGWGVVLADGASAPAGSLLGLYFGDICREPEPSSAEYALELPHFWSGAERLDLFVDAAASCQGPDPSPVNAAMYAHSCRDATMVLSATRLGPMPCIVARSRADLRGGQALTWNYDGHGQGSAYTIDRHRRAELLAEGVAMVPCACRSPTPCPRSHWLLDFSH
jgi:hypothetical protein